jgi:hypothetical protein
MNGTSAATAIAAGIGALILEFSRLSGAPKIDKRYVDRLVQLKGMKSVLYKRITARRPTPSYNYIRPWLLFGDPVISDVKAVERISSTWLTPCHE